MEGANVINLEMVAKVGAAQGKKIRMSSKDKEVTIR